MSFKSYSVKKTLDFIMIKFVIKLILINFEKLNAQKLWKNQHLKK